MVRTVARSLNIVNFYSLSQTNWESKKKRFKFLEEENDLEVERRAGGRMFHARGPATENARSPIDARWVGGDVSDVVSISC